jgi:hypothetical protein
MDVLMGKSSINNPEDYLFVRSHGSPPPRLAKTRAGAGHGESGQQGGISPTRDSHGFVSENRGNHKMLTKK